MAAKGAYGNVTEEFLLCFCSAALCLCGEGWHSASHSGGLDPLGPVGKGALGFPCPISSDAGLWARMRARGGPGTRALLPQKRPRGVHMSTRGDKQECTAADVVGTAGRGPVSSCLGDCSGGLEAEGAPQKWLPNRLLGARNAVGPRGEAIADFWGGGGR